MKRCKRERRSRSRSPGRRCVSVFVSCAETKIFSFYNRIQVWCELSKTQHLKYLELCPQHALFREDNAFQVWSHCRFGMELCCAPPVISVHGSPNKVRTQFCFEQTFYFPVLNRKKTENFNILIQNLTKNRKTQKSENNRKPKSENSKIGK